MSEKKIIKVCPRCGWRIIGQYPALSRKDNKTEICSECGIEEALEAAYKIREDIRKEM